MSSLPSWEFLRKRHFLQKCRIYVPHISLKWTTLQTWKPSFWSADHKNGDKSKYDSKQLKGHISFFLLPPPPFSFLLFFFFKNRPIHFCRLCSIQSSLSYLRCVRVCIYREWEHSTVNFKQTHTHYSQQVSTCSWRLQIGIYVCLKVKKTFLPLFQV